MFVSVQMFSYICRWACVNCSKNTLFTVKSQQCDIKFLQDLHYISKKKKNLVGQQGAKITADLDQSTEKLWNQHTHSVTTANPA